MAITTNSGVIEISTGEIVFGQLSVTCLLISNNTSSTTPIDVTIRESDNSTVILRVTVPEDDSVVIPFGGRLGKNFPNGMTFTQVNVRVTAFLV